MKFYLKTLLFIALLSCISGSQAAIILKKKNKQALIHLEGIKTKRGSYFEVIDFYGQKKGLVQIKRVGEQKAIGIVRTGKVGKRWSLEPVSKRKAVVQMRKQKRAMKLALIRKEKIKKRLALKKRRMAYKRKLAKKRRALRRSLASYEDSEYILDDLPEEASYQSKEVLSYGAETPSPTEEGFSSEEVASQNRNFDEKPQSPSRIFLGLTPRFEYNIMNVNPEDESSPYLMQGFGGGLFAYFDFSLNSFIRTELNLGFKQFSVGAKAENCGESEDCSLDVNYIVGSGNLKLNIAKWAEHQFWGAFEGVIMHPVADSNRTRITDNQTSRSPGTIGGPHGTIGGALGLDLTFGRLVFPVSLRAGVYMPPTATIMTGTVSFQMGLAYKL